MATIKTAAVAYRKVARTAESIRNGDPETVGSVSPGDCVRQGDLYLVALDREPKRSGPYEGRQLATGTTRGSRHVAEGEGVTLYTPDEADAISILNRLVPATRGHQQFLGPVILVPGGVTITHPEHGDRTLEAGVYLVTQQRSWADTLRRAAD